MKFTTGEADEGEKDGEKERTEGRYRKEKKAIQSLKRKVISFEKRFRVVVQTYGIDCASLWNDWWQYYRTKVCQIFSLGTGEKNKREETSCDFIPSSSSLFYMSVLSTIVSCHTCDRYYLISQNNRIIDISRVNHRIS